MRYFSSIYCDNPEIKGRFLCLVEFNHVNFDATWGLKVTFSNLCLQRDVDAQVLNRHFTPKSKTYVIHIFPQPLVVFIKTDRFGRVLRYQQRGLPSP